MTRPGKSLLSRGLCVAIAIVPLGVAQGQIDINGAAMGLVIDDQTVCSLRGDTLALYVADATLAEIFMVDAATGAIITSFPAPGPNPQGLTTADLVGDPVGMSLFVTDPADELIYLLDATGTVVDSFPASGTGATTDARALCEAATIYDTQPQGACTPPTGIEIIAAVWIANGDQLCLVSTTDGAPIRTIPAPCASAQALEVGGFASAPGFATAITLFVGCGDTIYEVSAADGQVINSFAAPGSDTTGLAFAITSVNPPAGKMNLILTTLWQGENVGDTVEELSRAGDFVRRIEPECGEAERAHHGSARGAGDFGNVVYIFDADGTYTGVEYPQIEGAAQDLWGYRDGAGDGTYVYFGWSGGVARHDADGANGVLVFDGTNAPGGTYRALAYDPTGDNDNGSFWSASFSSGLVEVAATAHGSTNPGDLLNSYPNDGWSLYGLAYNDLDGTLWGHTSGGEVIKIGTSGAVAGRIIAGGWMTAFVHLQDQGGLSGLHDGTGRIAAVSQGATDEFGIYDLSGAFTLGPIDWQRQTGNNRHLGVAVVPVSAPAPCAGFLCGDASCDGVFNGGDIDPFFLALGNPAAWQAAHPNCDLLCVADINHDGAVNGGDIDAFFAALGAGACP